MSGGWGTRKNRLVVTARADVTDPRWKWQVTCRYNDTAAPPRRPGDIAIRTVHATDVSKDMEVRAAGARTDVDVEVVRLRD